VTAARRRALIAYGLLAPAFLLVAAWVLYPLWVVVETSLRQGRSPNIARLSRLPLGPDNYLRAVTDPEVWHAALVTAGYAVGTIAPAFLLGLSLALLLDREFPGRRWVRSLMLVPWAVPGVVVAIAFLWMFDASYGVVNAQLRNLGLITTDVAWFVNGVTALPAVILPTIWKCFPFFVLTLLAALQAVPPELHEAAKVDGATAWQRFRFVTWPTIRGAAALAIVLQTLWAVKEFDIIYATTGGGPARATQTLSLLVYEEAFQFFRFGYASAVGMLLLAACAILSFLSIRWSRPPGS
jgi:multiple sugar transport system permease protein